jgi:hypothetical protein
MVKKIVHKDPFVGEIELTQVAETSMHLMGESRIDTIYSDARSNLYINTWVTTGGDPIPMVYLRKELVDIIKKL